MIAVNECLLQGNFLTDATGVYQFKITSTGYTQFYVSGALVKQASQGGSPNYSVCIGAGGNLRIMGSSNSATLYGPIGNGNAARLVMESTGVLTLYSSAGAVLWTASATS